MELGVEVGVGVAAVGVSSGEADDAGGSKVGDAEGVGVEPQAARMAAIADAASIRARVGLRLGIGLHDLIRRHP
jgi:hypothetical protein